MIKSMTLWHAALLLLFSLKVCAVEDTIAQNDTSRQAKEESTVQMPTGYPVVPYRDTLFYIYTRTGSFTAADRAASISTRIRTIGRRFHPKKDSILIVTSGSVLDLMYHDMIIMSISDSDAQAWHKQKYLMAEELRNKITDSIILHRRQTNVFNILMRIGLVILVLAAQYFLIRLMNRLFRKLREKIKTLKDSKIKGISIKGYQLLDSENSLKIILLITKIIHYFFIALFLYLTIPVYFIIFPGTKNIALTLYNYILNPLKKVSHGFLDYIPNLITIIVIFVIIRYIVRLIKYFSNEIEKGRLTIRGFYPDWAKPTFNIIRFFLYAFMFVIIFPYLPGSESPIFKGVSIFIGVIFSLGSTSAIANLVAGLVITYMRPFKIGDRVKIGDTTGDVIEKTPFVTRLRTIKNEEITIPNASILTSHTINYSTSAKEKGLIVHTSVTIGYDAPWRIVHKLLIDAAKNTKDILKRPEPFVLQTSLDDFYVTYQINAYTREPSRQATIYSELHQNIQDQFNQAGVEIMSPHYKALRDGNTIAIPPDYIPEDYRSPAFKVKTNGKNKDESER
jgi:small-conductance mechanosensitive channel